MSITLWLHNAQYQSLKLSYVIIADSEINAEAIPGLPVPIAQMLLQPSPEIPSQANVVKPLAAIECVDAVSFPGALPKELLVFG